jgi:TATA-binding protein-associated factor
MKKHFSHINSLRLDGDVPAQRRPTIVSRFNDDPTIRILFLTTQVVKIIVKF